MMQPTPNETQKMCIRDRDFNIAYDHVSFAYQTTQPGPDAVSYTHLDVYKRQEQEEANERREKEAEQR